MADGKVILAAPKFDITLRRLCHQLIENYDDFSNTCIIGIQERGAVFSDHIVERLREITGTDIEYGKLDISFYRDDFRRRDQPISPSVTSIDFLVEDKRVILMDDVLYTGRTIHAAMTALQHFGRPKEVELMSFVDRRFNRQLPVSADYVGITVDAIDEAYVRVDWAREGGQDQILFFGKKVEA